MATQQQQRRLHRLIADHGFDSWGDEGAIVVAIPTSRRLPNGEVVFGEVLERCAPTVAAVRAVLGY